MAPDKKPRSDAWEMQLTEEQRWEIYARSLRSGLAEVLVWVRNEFGIAPPSVAGYYEFLKRMRKQEAAHRLQEAITARAEAGELAAAAAPNDEESAAALQAYGLNIALKTGDSKTAKEFVEMALAIRKSALDKQALDLSKEKFDAQEKRLNEAKKCLDPKSKLTPEERAQKVKEIFG